MLLRRISLLLALAWMALLFYLSHQPGLDVPALFKWQDKVFHAGVYGILGILLLAAMPLTPNGFTWRQVSIAAVIASFYGISDEFHQSFIPGRSAEVGDWLADTVGALLAALLLAQLSRRYRKMAIE
jgi:VanZ family protein